MPESRKPATHPGVSAAHRGIRNASDLKKAPLDYRLAVGPFHWRISPGAGLEDWGARLARILELEPLAAGLRARPGERRIFYIKTDVESAPEDLRDFLANPAASGWPRAGWQSRWFFPVRIWSHPDFPDLVCEVVLGLNHDLDVDSMLKACYPLLESVVLQGGVPLHSALVARAGMGVALAASGGTGKSTCSRRIPPPWRALCDDATILLPGDSGAFDAHPFATWSDYLWKRSEGTWNVASHVPLKAVFFLKQASEDKASAIGQGEAAIYLGRSATEVLAPYTRRLEPKLSRAFKGRVFDNACRMAKTIPAFLLEVSLEGQFWKEIERVIGK